MLKEINLIPQAFFVQHIAMICCEDDDGIVQLAHLFNRLNPSIDLTVKIADICVIGPTRAPDFLLGQKLGIGLNPLQYPLGKGIGCIIGMAQRINFFITLKRPPCTKSGTHREHNQTACARQRIPLRHHS